jgi:aryl-alcohol dehydrogenase-like predicted oxidoreductase
MTDPSRLILGGHSFIRELGNDPEASFDEQCALVAACLDAGVRRIDTTYYQERVALGRVLERLGRRNEAVIQVWNFFREPGRERDLVPWTPYEPHHLNVILDELQTNQVDLLVVHVHDDADRLGRELALAREWLTEGKVGEIGLGMAQSRHLDLLPRADHPVTHVLAPYNAFHQDAAEMFARARGMGLRAVAMSPFVRGWKMDEIAARGEDRAQVADVLLRWVAGQPLVDHVIVSMRRAAWVATNLRSLARGPLGPEERARLDGWLARLS